MKWKKWAFRLLAAVILVTGLALWLHWENQTLGVTEIQVTCPGLPANFDGYRIAQISDLHNTEFGENNERLLTMLQQTQPDIIVLTGDLVDSRKTDLEISIAFGVEAAKIAPTYYVTGNHEERMFDYWKLRAGLYDGGVILLENRSISLEKEGQSISLVGIRDPLTEMKSVNAESTKEKQLKATYNLLEPLMDATQDFTILLAHRPEAIAVYEQCGVDLAFCGHLHGGQFRVPIFGGLFTLGQGFFPEHDAGLYQEGDTQMIVSRGLGNSAFPFRINNKPEIVLAILNCE